MADTSVLSFREMALRRGRGTLGRRLVQLILSAALRLFFRRIETYGAGRVPAGEPLIFVLNHPNGLIDPALVFCALPRRISFLAKSTLFTMPVLGQLLRAVEALPVYRRVDAPADVSLNRLTFRRCRELLRRNRCIAIFPEGRSHNETSLLPVKTGAARIALGALADGDENDQTEIDGKETAKAGGALGSLKIAPVGLYYTAKTRFRSEALMRFGTPFAVAPAALGEDGEPARDAVQELSQKIERALREVTLNVPDDEELEAVVRAEQLFSSIYESLNFRQPLAAEFELRRRFAETLTRSPRPLPRGVETLRARLREYEEDLGRFGIVPENLSVLAHSRWHVFRHFLLRLGVVLLLSPLVAAGALLHLPAYLLSTLFSKLFPKHGVDDIRPTVKILAAVLLVPLTWLTLAAFVYFSFGWRPALLSIPAAALCGYVALRSLEETYDLRGWFRASLLLVRDRRRFIRLLLERRSLHREVRRLVETNTAATPAADAGE
ncbi:MAG TPA: lysophospholipid acyltransferase family protein [Pyrinomonadaceae bacterium]|nr:lysophospholipid acyltransferase family protein [Pyrinomonadaceae bacterium]